MRVCCFIHPSCTYVRTYVVTFIDDDPRNRTYHWPLVLATIVKHTTLEFTSRKFDNSFTLLVSVRTTTCVRPCYVRGIVNFVWYTIRGSESESEKLHPRHFVPLDERLRSAGRRHCHCGKYSTSNEFYTRGVQDRGA